MADKFFHEFPTATTLKDTSILLLDQDNQTTAVTLDQLKSFFIPTGSVLMFAASGVPTGWLECNGSVLPINNYTKLYNVIGHNYKTISTINTLISFQIPDLRGEFVRGWDNKKGVDSGRTFASSQSASWLYTHVGSNENGSLVIGGSQFDDIGTFTSPNLGPLNTASSSSKVTGPKLAMHPRNVALVYCIKT